MAAKRKAADKPDEKQQEPQASSPVEAERPNETQEVVASAPADGAKVKGVIAEGKSMTSKKGILGPGAVVKPEYLSGGKESYDAMVEKGVIV